MKSVIFKWALTIELKGHPRRFFLVLKKTKWKCVKLEGEIFKEETMVLIYEVCLIYIYIYIYICVCVCVCVCVYGEKVDFGKSDKW